MRKYRLFGFINPVDVLLVLLIAGIVWGLSLLSAPQDAIAGTGVTIVRYTIEFAERPEGFYQGISPGTVVLDSVRGFNIGTVVYAYGLPFLQDVPDETYGIIRRTPVAGLEFTYVVVEALAEIDEYATRIGQYIIGVNREVFIRSRDFAGRGFITSLEVQN